MKKIIEQIMKKDGLEKLLYLKQLVTTEWKKKFSNYQLKQITKGIEYLLDVSIYARPEKETPLGLMLGNNLDVTIYAKKKFNTRQMQQILFGLEQRVDVTNYAKSELNWEEMKEVRLQLLKESTEK